MENWQITAVIISAVALLFSIAVFLYKRSQAKHKITLKLDLNPVQSLGTLMEWNLTGALTISNLSTTPNSIVACTHEITDLNDEAIRKGIRFNPSIPINIPPNSSVKLDMYFEFFGACDVPHMLTLYLTDQFGNHWEVTTKIDPAKL